MRLPSRILVTGDRDFKDYDFICKTMDGLVPYFNDSFCLIHGGARGVDMLVHQWVFFNGCAVIRMDANWDHYGKAAGHIRNGWMLDFGKPDVLIEFPGGYGTANMAKQAKERKIIVHKVIYGSC